MPGIKEIRTKIKSVQNTRKITKAMEMVAASKMRKAQERMRAGRPYATKVREIAAHLMQANPEYSHPYLVEREVKAVGVVLVTTDKGLCGGLNTNISRVTLSKLKEFEQRSIKVQATAFGNKGLGLLTRIGAKPRKCSWATSPTSTACWAPSRCSWTTTWKAVSTRCTWRPRASSTR